MRSTYIIYAETNGEAREVYESTTKREIERYFGHLKRLLKKEKGTFVYNVNLGCFKAETRGGFGYFTTEYWIAKKVAR